MSLILKCSEGASCGCGLWFGLWHVSSPRDQVIASPRGNAPRQHMGVICASLSSQAGRHRHPNKSRQPSPCRAMCCGVHLRASAQQRQRRKPP